MSCVRLTFSNFVILCVFLLYLLLSYFNCFPLISLHTSYTCTRGYVRGNAHIQTNVHTDAHWKDSHLRTNGVCVCIWWNAAVKISFKSPILDILIILEEGFLLSMYYSRNFVRWKFDRRIKLFVDFLADFWFVVQYWLTLLGSLKFRISILFFYKQKKLMTI